MKIKIPIKTKVIYKDVEIELPLYLKNEEVYEDEEISISYNSYKRINEDLSKLNLSMTVHTLTDEVKITSAGIIKSDKWEYDSLDTIDELEDPCTKEIFDAKLSLIKSFINKIF